MAPFEPGTGAVKAAEAKAVLGSSFSLSWSPGGQRLAYIKEASGPRGSLHRLRDQLTIRDTATGKERRLAPRLVVAGFPDWSPDGRSILVDGAEGTDPESLDREAFYRVDARAGTAEKLLQVPDSGRWWLGRAVWDPGGDAILYTLFDRLIRRDLETGAEETLFRNSNLTGRLLAVSPDGEWLAMGVGNPERRGGNPHSRLEGGGRILLLPLAGGQPRSLARVTGDDSWVRDFAWAPDGESLFFLQGNTESHSLWRASVRGGGAEKLWEKEGWVTDFAVHPSGSEVAYSELTQEIEIWTMEGLADAVEQRD